MALFEDRVLTDTIEINTTPGKMFHYLTGIVSHRMDWKNAIQEKARRWAGEY
jgi:hypothetical protein